MNLTPNFQPKNIVKDSKLIKGVLEFLKWAKSKNISMGVCTNKQEHLAIDLLKKIEIYDYFEYHDTISSTVVPTRVYYYSHTVY